MNEECLICKKPLVYTETGEMMECFLCHKRESSKTKCADGHYICNDCHTKGMDALLGFCRQTESKNPVAIIRQMMRLPFCHMHGPEHHVMVGAALLTAFRNAGGDIDLHGALLEMMNRGKSVPGGACGFWGACGAGISTGMFVSILSKSTPLANEPFALAHRMTSKALARIGEIGGPRCCKRDSFLSILAAIDFVAEHFDVKMESEDIACEFSSQNNQCIGIRCPFFQAKHR
ncbi:MAG: SAM-dependent methyltransferase [Schwartzia sp.]|nr:SAM-dependent methyltransferase [Schwartzia sp. (in: firmicutes)]